MSGLLPLVRRHAIAAPGADTNILTTGIIPKEDGVMCVTVCLTTGSVFNVTITDGTTSYVNGLGASAALNSGDMYTFCFGCLTSLTYNFQVETNSVIRELHVFVMTNSIATNAAQGA